ncbi:MAG: hypothetical protein JNM56_01225 [Planctomycetia bacterium]|nr:hypothetical protein [Planctomycetia bacterium]
MRGAGTYLRIPVAYAAYFDGLRWSENGDALETDQGTFALTGEVALFLEGFLSSHRLIHFGYILNLIGMLGVGKLVTDTRALQFRRLLQECGGSVRNVGVFAARLCTDVPSVAEPIDLEQIKRQWVTSNVLLSLLCATSEVGPGGAVAEALPWPPDQFEARVCRALKDFPTDHLKHWFRHGRGPVRDGEQLAEELEAVQPRTLAGVLTAATRRERLHGAVRFVAQLVGALSLPPRRLTPNELSLGGYADVTTRGQPEQLLLSQFALDDLEFVRRFAARELLYYRREEPHTPLREELVLLLDQGVRTWGDVRLVLGAAVFALGKRAVARKVPLRLATTANGGRLLDPLRLTDDEFGALLEASDLSLQPGPALARVLEDPAEEATRDIVLLTHPLNLAEPEVATAARGIPPGVRLFALAVDDRGRAQLAELRHGSAVPLTNFRIDLTPPAEPVPAPAPDERPQWVGDVEPLPFPFRFGLTSRPEHFAFDASGDWLLVVSHHGILHAHQCDGSLTEVLPRGVLDKQVLTAVETVLGVAGGFVVGGRIGTELVAMHYDLAERRCTAHRLGVRDGNNWAWHYAAEFHSVVVANQVMLYGVDLGTGQRAMDTRQGNATDSRVALACAACSKVFPTIPHLFIYTARNAAGNPLLGVSVPDAEEMLQGSLALYGRTGTLLLHTHAGQQHRFQPLADGQPVLRDCQLIAGQLCGNTLGFTSFREGEPTKPTLRLLDVERGVVVREFASVTAWPTFALSADGRRLARLIGAHQLGVYDLAAGGVPQSVTPSGGCHSNLTVEQGEDWLELMVGERVHRLRWGTGTLELFHDKRGRHARAAAPSGSPPPRTVPQPLDAAWYQTWYHRLRLLSPSMYADRFVLVDQFGQVAIVNRARELLVMFFVFRDKLAAWLPDGTRYGPASVTGGPATPQALERIGQVLQRGTP